MGFADALEAAAGANRPKCTVAKALAALDDSDRAAAVAAIDELGADGDYRWPGSTVAKALAAESGVNVAGQTLNRHRKRGSSEGCACEL